MRIRTTTAAVTAVLALTLVGCGSGDTDGDRGDDGKTGSAGSSAPAASDAADGSAAAEAAGIPPEPDGDLRSAVLQAVQDVNGELIHDEDKAIDAARNQCAALDGGAENPDHAAAQRFSYDGVTLTDDDGRHLNVGLRSTLCPES